MNPSSSNSRLMALPKTIEEATRRYLHHYHNNFSGSASDMVRLKHMTHAFIYRLRKIAPRFYEEKLPTFVNQACSSLLLCDTNTRAGADQFHITHGIFLSILDEFKRSQPAGDVDFASEKRRYEEKRKLIERQLELQRRIEEIDAVEIDIDEVGEDEDFDSQYAKVMAEKESMERELASVAMEIAVIEGVDLDEEVNFVLRVPPRSILNRLTKEELQNLEKQMLDFYMSHKDRTAIYVDISLIEGMFDKLNIAPERFQKEQLNTMRRDALDAYRAYFRGLDKIDRNRYFDKLIQSKHLLPKEGAILDPDNIPEDVRLKLEYNDLQGQQGFEEILESFGARVCNEKEIGDELQDSGDEAVDERAQVIERLKLKGIKYERVKEEPRDDCNVDEFLMEEEFVVDSKTADVVVDNRIVAISQGQTDYVEDDRNEDQKPRKIAKREEGDSDGQRNSDERSNSYEEEFEDEEQGEEEDDDDIECLGTIEPVDKIKLYQLPEE